MISIKVRFNIILFLLLLNGCSPKSASTPSFFSDAYWFDGKAEFSLYRAQLLREGALRSTDLISILVQEPFAPDQFVKADDPAQPGTYSVLKLNQITRIPTGIYVWQQMLSLFWRRSDAQLLKWSLASSDSCGNTFKLGERLSAGSLRYRWFTYWQGMAEGSRKLNLSPATWFYDEIPLRVRTLDFRASTGTLDLALYPSFVNPKRDDFPLIPAHLEYRPKNDTIEVTISYAGQQDLLTLSPNFPYFLLRWSKANGESLVLTRVLKLPYWKYNQPDGAEKALADPTLTVWPAEKKE